MQEYLYQHEEVAFDVPSLADSQTLGIQPNLLRYLPRFYLLSAITDYSSEIDKRSSTTIFRRLMGDLADRILVADERYTEISDTLNKLRSLLNAPTPGTTVPNDRQRLQSLEKIEKRLTVNIRQLMPSVEGVRLDVELEDTRDFFSRGVTLRVDDGIVTDVLQKGHGLQRSVVFGLLRMLIESQRVSTGSIILAIEEPELYIHPQMQRLIFGVLREFAKTDQVIYSTHSPAFIEYLRIQFYCISTKRNCAKGNSGVPMCGEYIWDFRR